MVTRGSGRSPPKVVVIETRHVRTDAEHFKEVVQSLTGKDSTLEAVVPEKPAIISYVGGFIGGRCTSAFGVVARWPATAANLLPMQPRELLQPPPSALTLKQSESLNSASEVLLADDGRHMLRQRYPSDYFY